MKCSSVAATVRCTYISVAHIGRRINGLNIWFLPRIRLIDTVQQHSLRIHTPFPGLVTTVSAANVVVGLEYLILSSPLNGTGIDFPTIFSLFFRPNTVNYSWSHQFTLCYFGIISSRTMAQRKGDKLRAPRAPPVKEDVTYFTTGYCLRSAEQSSSMMCYWDLHDRMAALPHTAYKS